MRWGRLPLIPSALVLVAILLTSRAALALGVGVELGATGVQPIGRPGEGALWGPTGGIVLDQRVPLLSIFLDPWLDVQAPLQLETGLSFLAIDLGLKLGIALAPVEPYIGALGQLNVLMNQGEDPDGREDVVGGFGGDVGVDFVLSSIRFGVEARGIFFPVIYQGDDGVPAAEFQLLATARFSF
jgi:hypothetical protein